MHVIGVISAAAASRFGTSRHRLSDESEHEVTLISTSADWRSFYQWSDAVVVFEVEVPTQDHVQCVRYAPGLDEQRGHPRCW